LTEKPNTRVVAVKVNHIENLENDDVKIIKISNAKLSYLPRALGSFFMNVEEYYVMSSNLRFIMREDFEGLTKIKSLSFYQNNIKDIPEDALFDLTELKFLSISYNQLTSLPMLLLQNLRELEYISFTYNKLKYLSLYLFEFNTKLQSVSFEHNDIAVFPPELVFHLSKPESLNLNGNKCIDQNFDLDDENMINRTYEALMASCYDEQEYEVKVLAHCQDQLTEVEAEIQDLLEENKKLQGSFEKTEL
jgi:Leucine-rich repeat (LRR) protein